MCALRVISEFLLIFLLIMIPNYGPCGIPKLNVNNKMQKAKGFFFLGCCIAGRVLFSITIVTFTILHDEKLEIIL